MTYARNRAHAHTLRLSCSMATLLLFGPQLAVAQTSDPAEGRDVVVITGSYVARDQSQLSSPTQVLGSEEIASTGRVGIDDLLSLNTANTGSLGGVQDLADGGQDNRATRSANLRGLGPSSTLVLLNGRRMASVEQDNQRNIYTNLAAMTPSIVVDRVETVLDGASALYGSDAIAGVLNVITDTDAAGARFSAQYTDIKDAPAYIVQGRIGGRGENFSGVLAVSFEHQGNLQGEDRDRTNFNNLSGASHPGSFSISARPTTSTGGDVIINNGVNGPINYTQLYDSFATGGTLAFADPYCTVSSTGGIYTGANPFPRGRCFFSYQQDNPLIPETDVTLIYGAGQIDINDSTELYAEMRYYNQHSDRYGVSSFGISTSALTVPASNPYNPFRVPVTIPTGQFRVTGSEAPKRLETTEIDGIHAVGGLRGDLAFVDGWRYDLSYVWSRETQRTNFPDTDVLSLQLALNGFGGPDCRITPTGQPAAGEVAGAGNCVYYSPFAVDDNTLDPRARYNMMVDTTNGSQVEYQIGEAVITGSLFELPAGPVGVAFGAQYRREYQAVEIDSGVQAGRFGFQAKGRPGSGTRELKALFTEFQIPVTDTLNAQIAARYEDYGSFTTTNPKVGVNWQILDQLSLRESASTAFRAPALSQSVTTAVQAGVGQTFDRLQTAPADPGTFRVINTVANANLQPEESTNYNLGATWEPISDLRLSLDYWRFEFENQIALENAQQVIDRYAPTYVGPALTRGPSGELLAVNIGYFNAGSTETAGVDLRADYRFDIGPHEFTISNMASYIDTYKVQIGPTQPTIEAKGRRNSNNPGYTAPEWRNNLTLGWRMDKHSANLTARYTSGVLNDLGLALGASPTVEIDSWTVFDAQYAFAFGDDDQYKLAIGAINILDDEPPQASFTGYLPSIHDVLGRQAYVRVTADF